MFGETGVLNYYLFSVLYLTVVGEGERPLKFGGSLHCLLDCKGADFIAGIVMRIIKEGQQCGAQ